MRQTRTFLAGDIEGSTRRWLDDESAMSAALSQHDEAVTAVVSSAGGEVFKHTGDGFFAAFADPDAAVTSAIRIQREVDLPIRMAVATGPAESRDGDWYGGVLSRTARLMDSGSAGQVLLGDVTASLVRDHLDAGVDLIPLGRHRFRDLHEPYEVFQLVAPDLETEFSPIKSLESFPNNLPVQMTSFIGRADEILRTTEMVDAGRLVTLTGVGGVGKTRLALAAAAVALESFPGGVWFVELASLADAGLIANQTMTAMGASADGREPVEIVIARCVEPTLLLLDNCEHLIDDVAKFAENVLRGAPEAKVLATSREGIGVMGESVYRVPSLRGDEGLADAVELFASRARQVDPAFVVDENNQDAVEQICRRLDGIPLAIELATARLRVLDAHGIADRLDDRFRLLTGGARTALPRQRTLAATMDWSYDLLSDKEQSMLRRLAVFAGSFSLEAAEAVCSDELIDGFEVLDLVERLVSASLVTPGEVGRFKMLETVRQYAVDKLAESGEVGTWRDSHANFFEQLASTINQGLLRAGSDELLAQLLADQDNLRLAMTHSIETGDFDRAGRIADGCSRFWQSTSAFAEAYDWGRQIVDRVTDQALRGWLASHQAIWVENLRRSHEEGRRWDAVFWELVPGPPEDPLKRVQWWHTKGLALHREGRPLEAYEAYLNAESLASQVFPEYVVSSWMAVLVGVTLQDPPDFDGLLRRLEDSVTRESSATNAEAALGLLAWAWVAKDMARARDLHEQHRSYLPDGYVSMSTSAFWGQDVHFALEEGDVGRARASLDRLRTTAEANVTWKVGADAIEARIDLAEGNLPGAIRAILRAVSGIEPNDLRDVVPVAVLVIEAAGDRARAAAFLRGMESHNELHGHAMEPWVREPVGEVRSRLGALLDEADPIPLETDDLPAAKAELTSRLESLLE